ncbi:uncharacterized protein [Haliaeetus albicilla]|uniref:uncharacterized protein isoform X2 n=1 Tax=Haliaeetus albicilla TaxID=8969 RepID=UPI0037E7A2E9
MSQLPKGRITPGAKPRGGGRQLSFPRLWCHLPASAALQVSAEALITTAELLKWKELKHLVQTQQTWRTGECLLVQDRSRAEEYLSQSLPYLGDAQATLREVAVRFIGLAARPLRDQSREKLAEIDRALQPMQEDSEPAIGSLALQTIFILNSPRVQQTWGRSLRALCCGCC